MKRRALLLLVSTALCAIATAAACGFPDVGYATDPADGAPPDALVAGDSGDAAEDTKVVLDGGDPDALIVRDAGQRVDAATCQPDDCDCDKDGFRSTLKAGCEGGANDCDDNDPRAQPNQGYLLDKAESPLFGDWNCSTKVEMLYPENVDCQALSPGTKTCDQIAGFEGTVGCSNFGKVVKCKTVPVPPLNLTSACAVGAQFPNTQQACK
ncbi:hypothetical protein BH11MYX4_BH11MYX4_61360 [soil metagenome]